MDATTRRSNLRSLIEKSYDGSQAQFAVAIEKSEGRVTQLLTDGQPFGELAARRIEEALSLPAMYLDRGPGSGQEPPPRAPVNKVAAALEALGDALAGDLPADVRDDVADALHKLAKRGGGKRDQQQVAALLQAESGKQRSAA
jgi:hypothetical protein